MNKKATRALTYGLFVLTAQEDGRDNGCIINTAQQVTTDPNRITIAVNKANFTHDMVLATGAFNVSVISEEADFALFQHFGFQTGREVDKFAGYADCVRSENGLYYVTKGTNAYFSAQVENTIDLGTHTLFIANVTDLDVLSGAASATYSYYQSQIKPKPEATKTEGRPAWRCKVCGYIYEGETLPADFICPLCKHPAEDFEKIYI